MMKLEEFYNKKILVIVPHQDDEINLAGSLILSLARKADIYVLYTTMGNYLFDSTVRRKEALEACKKLGVDSGHVIFLKYPDQPYDQKTHLYNEEGDWKDRSGKKYNKNELIFDVQDEIKKISPDIILCVDLDFHSDHIMTSLCVEKAIGNILSERGGYFPIVLKGFTYENAYHGPNDYNDENEKGMYINYDTDGNSKSNAYFNKDNRIEIIPSSGVTVRRLYRNKLYQAIKAHRSQLLVERAFRIMNPNLVFWKRETRNLIFEAKVEVSSGCANYLKDFLINDTSNVLNGDRKEIIYDKAIWIPERSDTKKQINICFDSPRIVEKVNIFHGNNGENNLSKVILKIDGEQQNLENRWKLSYVYFSKARSVKNIQITVLDERPRNGFSEIEILPPITGGGKTMKLETFKGRKISGAQQFLNSVINQFDILKAKIFRKICTRKWRRHE